MSKFRIFAVLAAIVAGAVAVFSFVYSSDKSGLTGEEKAARAREGKAAKQALRESEKENNQPPADPE